MFSVVAQMTAKKEDSTVAATVGQKRSVEEGTLQKVAPGDDKGCDDEERKKRLRLEEVINQCHEVTSDNETTPMEVDEESSSNVGGFNILPTDLRERVSVFLQTKEAYQLSRTCKSIKTDLALAVTNPPFRLFKTKSWNGNSRTGDKPRQDREIPIFFPTVRIHSIMLKCTWRDQGYGNQKGKLYIVGHPQQDDTDSEQKPMTFSNGRIVATSPIAGHQDQQLQLFFHPLDGEKYHLWYKAGSGGGHKLHVHNLDVYTVIHDTNEGSISKAFQFLSPSTSDLVFPTLLQALSRSVLGNFQTTGTSPDPILSAFLNEYGITTINEESLLGLETVAGIFLQDHWVDLTYDEKIDNLLMYIHFNDSQGGDLLNALHFLTNGKFLHPTPSRKLFTASIQAVTESLVDQINRKEFPDPILSDFLQSYGVSVEKEPLLILQKLGSMMQQHSEEEQPSVPTNQQQEADEEEEEDNDDNEEGEGDGDGDDGDDGNADAAAEGENADGEAPDQQQADDDDDDNEIADGENGNAEGEVANEQPEDGADNNDNVHNENADGEVPNEQQADDTDDDDDGNVDGENENDVGEVPNHQQQEQNDGDVHDDENADSEMADADQNGED